jgi:adenylate cyclase
MGTEIERKFLVYKDKLPELKQGTHIVQGYIPTLSGTTVRIRITGQHAFLTLKQRFSAFSRHEFEYPVPLAEAQEMLHRICQPRVLEKIRHNILYQDMNWEVDVFKASNTGLIIAELELTDEQQQFATPDWIADEVTLDERYSNSRLAQQAYSTWGKVAG